MKIETKKLLIKALLIWVPLICFIAYGLSKISQEERLLEKDPVYTDAIIIDTYVGAKLMDYVKYKFFVRDSSFTGHEQYFPRIESIYIGDTVKIVYARSNPRINKVLTNANKTLIIR